MNKAHKGKIQGSEWVREAGGLQNKNWQRLGVGMSVRFLKYMFSPTGLFAMGHSPSPFLTIYSSQDKEQDFWRDPMSDQVLGGKTKVNVSFVEEEIDEDLFYKPKKQGEVDEERGKQALADKRKLKEGPNRELKVESEKPRKYKARVLQLDGELDGSIPEIQKEVTKIERLGFASIMTFPFFPTMNLTHFDAFEYRVRVVDKRTWIANVGCKGDEDGEMYQALFTGDGSWTSVIIPFRKYLFTQRGMLIEDQQNIDSSAIQALGFLQAERENGKFCIQLESIRALSLSRLNLDIRYDPHMVGAENSAHIAKAEKDNDFDWAETPKEKDFYDGVFKY